MEQLNIDLIFKMYQDKSIYEANKHRFSDFTLGLFKKYSKNKKGMANVPYKIKCALYLDYMIKFYHLPKIIKSPPEVLSKQNDIELFFINQLLEKFAEGSYHLGEKDKNVKTPILILKNIYYILVLALMLYSFDFDYSLLAKSMKMEEKQIYNFYKEIGCKLSDYKKLDSKAHVQMEGPLKLNLENKSKYGGQRS